MKHYTVCMNANQKETISAIETVFNQTGYVDKKYKQGDLIVYVIACNTDTEFFELSKSCESERIRIVNTPVELGTIEKLKF